MTSDIYVCSCPDCGNEDICIPDAVCVECGTGLMQPEEVEES